MRMLISFLGFALACPTAFGSPRSSVFSVDCSSAAVEWQSFSGEPASPGINYFFKYNRYVDPYPTQPLGVQNRANWGKYRVVMDSTGWPTVISYAVGDPTQVPIPYEDAGCAFEGQFTSDPNSLVLRYNDFERMGGYQYYINLNFDVNTYKATIDEGYFLEGQADWAANGTLQCVAWPDAYQPSR